MKQAKPHGARYPWDKWFELGKVRLRRGVHYRGLTHGMVQGARQAAARRGLRLRVAVAADGNSLTLEVVCPA